MEPNQMNQAPQKAMWPWVVLVILILAALAFFLWQSNASENNTELNTDQQMQDTTDTSTDTTPDQTTTDTGTNTNTQTGVDVSVGAGETGTQVKTINVATGFLVFTPNEIRVKKGDKVRIVFTNTKGSHDWTIDEFNATTGLLEEDGATKTIEFVADKEGTFEYYCDFEDHREKGMVGKFIVEA